MSQIFAPTTVKQMRFAVKSYDRSADAYKVKSLEYLVDYLNEVIVSEKYILDQNVLVLNVKPDANKRQMKLALEGAYPDNAITKITSLNRKSTSRFFKGRKGSTEAFKRIYVRFAKPFDLTNLTGGDN